MLTSLAASTNVEGLSTLIKNMTLAFGKTSIIVDGVDECGQQSGTVAAILASIAKEAEGNVQTAIFSRNEDEIRIPLERGDYSQLSIEARREDLRVFVTSEVKARLQDGRLDIDSEDLKDEIVERLVEQARGM